MNVQPWTATSSIYFVIWQSLARKTYFWPRSEGERRRHVPAIKHLISGVEVWISDTNVLILPNLGFSKSDQFSTVYSFGKKDWIRLHSLWLYIYIYNFFQYQLTIDKTQVLSICCHPLSRYENNISQFLFKCTNALKTTLLLSNAAVSVILSKFLPYKTDRSYIDL